MQIKDQYESFIKDLEFLCIKHGVWFGTCYDECFIAKIDKTDKKRSLEDIFFDETKD